MTGKEVRPGDTLVGLAEHGFGSNGITDVRKAMLEHYGEDWHNKVVSDLGYISLGRLVQRPSIVYSGFMSKLTGGYDINKKPLAKVTSVAHITPISLGVEIADPVAPPDIMLKMQELRGFDDRTAYGKWHMGPGMIIATPEPDKVLDAAEAHGVAAKEIGRLTEDPGIRIRNKGFRHDSEWLEFPPHAA